MAVELLFVVGYFVIGRLFLTDHRELPASGIAPLSLITGIHVYVLVGALQAVLGAPTNPLGTLGIAISGGMVVALRRSNGFEWIAQRRDAALIAGLSGAVLFFVRLDWATVTPDSFDYATVSGLVGGGHLDAASPWLLLKRNLVVGIVHAPATLDGRYFLDSLSPILAISVIWLIIVSVMVIGRNYVARSTGLALGVLAGIVLTSSFQFWYQAFYLNGHMIVASCTAVAGFRLWIAAHDSTRVAGLDIACLAALAVLSIARPEGTLMAILLVLPALCGGRLAASAKRLLLMTVGAAALIWHAYIAYQTAPLSQALDVVERSVLLMAGLGLLLIVIGMAAPSSLLSSGRLWWILAGGEILTWVALLVIALVERDVIVDSVWATYVNLMSSTGRWGVSIVGLFVFALAANMLIAGVPRLQFRYPITVFIPLAMILAYERGPAYRVAAGDSLNRMWLHVLPLLVLWLAVSGFGRWRYDGNRRDTPTIRTTADASRCVGDPL